MTASKGNKNSTRGNANWRNERGIEPPL